jgi:hypothetical protein
MLPRKTHRRARTTDKPYWDRATRTLTLRGVIVKRFRQPSPFQMLILDVFEQEGWPPQIDDPITGADFAGAKPRLHNVIQNLNRHQLNRLIRFRGDGTGEGIRWQIIGE